MRKKSTKDWAIQTFNSNNNAADNHTNNNDFLSATKHRQTTSSNGSSPRHIPSPANNSESSISHPIHRAHKRKWRNGCNKRMEDHKNRTVDIPRGISSPNPSANRKTTEDQRNAPADSPKISAYRGEPAIYFDEAVINLNADKFKYCLVGKFPCSWPSLARIREWISRKWTLQGSCSISILGLQHVFIRLDNELDMLQIWVKNKWWVEGHLMKVFKWTPKFRPAAREPSSAAVWITLPLLSVVFFKQDLLLPITSLVGRTLAIDDRTTNLSRTNVARVCVEVDLAMELPGRVWIAIGEDGFWQDVRYENLPSYCSNCYQQGHSTKICKFNTGAVGTSNLHEKTTKSNPENFAIKDDLPQDQCVTSNALVQNLADGEIVPSKHAQIHPSIQDGDEDNQPVAEACDQPAMSKATQATVETSDELPSNRITLVEALDKMLENDERIRPRKNNENLGFGGAFTYSSIINEAFLRGTEKEQEHSKQQQVHEFPLVAEEGNNKVGGKTYATRMKFLTKKPILFRRTNKTEKSEIVDSLLEGFEPLGLKRYKYSDVQSMTSSFRDKIGEGGLSHVFKGMLPDGRLVAVKVISDSQRGEEEFNSEVTIIARTNHVNIISLLGFCSEGSKRAIIYEHVHNGSLDKFIYSGRLKHALSWEKLHQIAVDIAQALEYLHYTCRMSILHFGINPSNILLDENFRPKISGFGLAKLFPTGEINLQQLSNPRGTLGYIAPEQFSGKASDKSDVYSYGMLLLQMVLERTKVSGETANSRAIVFREMINKHILEQEYLSLGEVAWVEAEENAKKMILVGFWCTQKNPSDRPSMSMVLEMLKGSIEMLYQNKIKQ